MVGRRGGEVAVSTEVRRGGTGSEGSVCGGGGGEQDIKAICGRRTGLTTRK